MSNENLRWATPELSLVDAVEQMITFLDAGDVTETDVASMTYTLAGWVVMLRPYKTNLSGLLVDSQDKFEVVEAAAALIEEMADLLGVAWVHVYAEQREPFQPDVVFGKNDPWLRLLGWEPKDGVL